MSQPGVKDLTHYQGDSFQQAVRINYSVGASHTPADLTGWTAGVTLRNARTRQELAGLSAAVSNQGTDPGMVVMSATAVTTEGWTAGPSLVYDLALTETATGFVRTVLTGRIFVQPQEV